MHVVCCVCVCVCVCVCICVCVCPGMETIKPRLCVIPIVAEMSPLLLGKIYVLCQGTERQCQCVCGCVWMFV